MTTLNPKRVLIAIAAAAALGWTGWYCLRVGYARTLARLAVTNVDAAMAARAAALSPGDAEAQSAGGGVLGHTGRHAEALAAADRAVRLRPRDYYLWIELGQAREQATDQEGARRAFTQAVTLAPSYANARWQLGNLLLRMGRLDEAFVELRRAGSSNPTLLPNLFDLAWGVYQPDSRAVTAAVKPGSDVERVTLAITFAGHGENGAALEQFLLSGGAAKKDAEKLLAVFLENKAFPEAYQVWARLHGISDRGAESGLGIVRNGGFEESLLLGEKGFTWETTPGLANVLLSVDEANGHSGSKSLRIDFRGNSAALTPLLTQTVLVSPGSRYRLTFSARAAQFVSAAVPVVSIIDANKTSLTLAESAAVPSDPDGWRQLAIDFTAGPETRAVIIAIRRQACSNDPCPAFGTVWWDSFTLGTTGKAGPASGSEND